MMQVLPEMIFLSCRALPTPQAARKPRSNDTSGEFKSSVKDSKGEGMSMEQADRAQLKVCDTTKITVGLPILYSRVQ